MKRCRVEKVFAERASLQRLISLMHEANVSAHRPGQPEYYRDTPRETAAVRRASMDLTRALADLRKSDYDKVPGEK